MSDLEQKSELDLLREQASLMGVAFGPNIGLETLKERIRAHSEGAARHATRATDEQVNKAALLKQMRDEQMALIRVRITCMNPIKKNMEGEYFTFQNDLLGRVSKFVAFGEKTDEGYHVPRCILNLMKKRQYVQIKKVRDAQSNTNRITPRLVREFSIEELPPLTPSELKELGQRQMATGALED